MGCAVNSVENVVIEPVKAYFGNQHLICVDTIVGTGLGGKYFTFSSLLENFYVWFDDGVEADPAVANKTAIEVTIDETETAHEIAVLVAAAVNALAATKFIHAKVYGTAGAVMIENKGLGAPLLAAAANTSGFTIEVLRAGSKLDIGLLDGNVDLGIDVQVFDIVAHQYGSEVLGQLQQAVNIGPISMVLKETIKEKLEVFLQVPGQAYTPSGGEAVTGIGALSGSKQFTNTFDSSKMLVLHPTKNADSNYDGDFAFWLAYPKLNNLMFSGEEDRKLELEFTPYIDEIRVNEASKMVYGDWTQNFLK